MDPNLLALAMMMSARESDAAPRRPAAGFSGILFHKQGSHVVSSFLVVFHMCCITLWKLRQSSNVSAVQQVWKKSHSRDQPHTVLDFQHLQYATCKKAPITSQLTRSTLTAEGNMLSIRSRNIAVTDRNKWGTSVQSEKQLLTGLVESAVTLSTTLASSSLIVALILAPSALTATLRRRCGLEACSCRLKAAEEGEMQSAMV